MAHPFSFDPVAGGSRRRLRHHTPPSPAPRPPWGSTTTRTRATSPSVSPGLNAAECQGGRLDRLDGQPVLVRRHPHPAHHHRARPAVRLRPGDRRRRAADLRRRADRLGRTAAAGSASPSTATTTSPTRRPARRGRSRQHDPLQPGRRGLLLRRRAAHHRGQHRRRAHRAGRHLRPVRPRPRHRHPRVLGLQPGGEHGERHVRASPPTAREGSGRPAPSSRSTRTSGTTWPARHPIAQTYVVAARADEDPRRRVVVQHGHAVQRRAARGARGRHSTGADLATLSGYLDQVASRRPARRVRQRHLLDRQGPGPGRPARRDRRPARPHRRARPDARRHPHPADRLVHRVGRQDPAGLLLRPELGHADRLPRVVRLGHGPQRPPLPLRLLHRRRRDPGQVRPGVGRRRPVRRHGRPADPRRQQLRPRRHPSSRSCATSTSTPATTGPPGTARSSPATTRSPRRRA